MIGNDVVDLRDPESRAETLHPRFDARVFGEGERAAIEAAGDPERTRWKLWAAKEAAYKLARKRRPTTVFSPVRFEVELDEASEAAVVRHGSDRYGVTFAENDGALHAVAMADDAGARRVVTGWRRLATGEIATGDPEAPSRAVRELLCERIAKVLGVAPADLEVRRSGRVPRLWLRGEPAPVDLSLSHHGDWLGFACEIDPKHADAGGNEA